MTGRKKRKNSKDFETSNDHAETKEKETAIGKSGIAVRRSDQLQARARIAHARGNGRDRG